MTDKNPTVKDAVGIFMATQQEIDTEKAFSLLDAAVENFIMSDDELINTPLTSLTTAMITAWQVRANESEIANQIRAKRNEEDSTVPPRPLAAARNTLGKALRMAEKRAEKGGSKWTAPAIENAFPPTARARQGGKNRRDWSEYRERSLDEVEASQAKPAVQPPKVAKAS